MVPERFMAREHLLREDFKETDRVLSLFVGWSREALRIAYQQRVHSLDGHGQCHGGAMPCPNYGEGRASECGVRGVEEFDVSVELNLGLSGLTQFVLQA